MTEYSVIKAALEARLRDLTARANKIEDELSEPANADWEENAIESEGDEVLAGVGQVTLEEIRGVRLALAAIRDGTYGKCSECLASIRTDRLEALPEATKCARCA